MELKFQCPHCPAGVLVDPLETADEQMPCPNCEGLIALRIGPDIRGGGPIERCAVCGSAELFRRKDFPQKLGLALVTVAAVASLVLYGLFEVLWSWAVLIAAVLFDVALFYVLPRLTGCYKCQAEYRRAAPNPEHADYDLATADKYGH